VFALTAYAYCESIGRYDYIKYLPPTEPKFVLQARASEEVRLFGDPENDLSPVDGIDDTRAARLLELSRHFSPLMFRNTPYSRPVDFRKILESNPRLYVDRWNNATDLLAEEARPETHTILFDGPSSGPEDQQLRELLSSVCSARAGGASASDEPLTVMFWDTPGEDERTWKQAYTGNVEDSFRREYSENTKIYAHPFVVGDSGGGYELIMQYWFYYPFNDGANNHEGDWEHINVVITVRSDTPGLLEGEELREVLTDRPLSDLIISRAEYYFHHYVMAVDYIRMGAYADSSSFEDHKQKHAGTYRNENKLWNEVRLRANHPVASTHPLAFIGGDNKGSDQILAMPGGKNRDSHGTYPFPGIYKSVGALNATEMISGDVNTGRALLNQRAYDTYLGEGEIEILPDVEQLLPLVVRDDSIGAVARSRWAWLLLPVRWGFPASPSPGAGILKQADTGNISPVGPAYNSAWNRVGACKGYSSYKPHVFDAALHLDFQEYLHNRLGVFNVLVVGVRAIPPVNLAVSAVSFIKKQWKNVEELFGRRDDGIGLFPLFKPGRIPFRRMGFGVGLYPFVADDEIADVLVDALEEDQPSVPPGVVKQQTREVSWGIEVNFYVGKRIVSENLYRISKSRLLLRDDKTGVGADTRTWSAKLHQKGYSGALRFNLRDGQFQPFVKSGLGLSTYRLSEIEASSSEPGKEPTSRMDWVDNPSVLNPWRAFWDGNRFPHSWLPNEFLMGAGLEFIPFVHYGGHRWFSGYDYGIKLEYVHTITNSHRSLSQGRVNLVVTISH
jgi:hypothetical protein